MLGNLTADKRDKLEITWNSFGKVKTIKGTDPANFYMLSFLYDGLGNRVVKQNAKATGGVEEHNSEYYIRDAAGNVLAVYRLKSNYNKYPILQQINGDLVANAGLTAYAGFIHSLGLDRPALVSDMFEKAIAGNPTWVNNTIAGKAVSYYLENDEELQTRLIGGTETYLDDLQEYDSPVGADVISEAIFRSKMSQQAAFLKQTLMNYSTSSANLDIMASELSFQSCQVLWGMFEQEFFPEDIETSVSVLAEFIINNDLQADASYLILEALNGGGEELKAKVYQRLIIEDAIFKDDELRSGDGTDFELGLLNMLKDNGDRNVLVPFLAGWTPLEVWMDEHVTSMEKLNVIFNTDPIPLLSGVASNATVALDDAITELDGLTIGEYAARIAGSGIIATPLPVPQTNVRDEFTLAEHHLYGSAHLGIQYYDPTVTTGIKNVADYLQPTNPALNSFDLNVQKSWYNYAYGDVITAGQKLPWNNWNQADGLGSYRLLGMRQYALSDHLGNVLATVLDRRLGHPSGSGNKYDYWQADIASAQDYYPFGMLMPGRVVQGDKFRFGFNGQEKVNEISGIGNHNTALFWEYDTRLGRRWNRDPVVKPYRSPYDAFDNSPIWRVDPDGDDDYYNKYGKWVGNDGVGNGIRIIGAETVEKFSQQLSKYGIEAIRSVSREVKVQDDAQVKAILKDIKVNTEATGVENKAYFILDTGDEPSLSIVRQRQVSGDTKKKSVNTYTKRVVITTEGKEIMFLYSESENKVVVGQVHGHENKKAVENTMHGTTINATSTAPKTSHNDEDAANEMGVPIHAVDYTGNVQRTVPGQEGSTTLNPGQQVLIESLEKSGGKP